MNNKTKNFIEKSKKIHGDKYDYSNVIYKRCNIKVSIICKIHGEFKQIPYSHLLGHGCRKCGHINSSKKRSSALDDFIKKSKIIHGNKYDYSNVKYKNNRTKVVIICKTHGIFKQKPNDHLLGHGCYKCGKLNCAKKLSYNVHIFIEKSKLIHGDKYDYSNVKYKNNRTKVVIICKIHGEFEQTPKKHLKKQGCPKCSRYCMDQEYFIERAKMLHGNKYNYSNVIYLNINTKINIICKIHGEFKQTPSCHLCGKGCSKCAGCYMDQEYFIEKARMVHENKYNYPNVIYLNNKTKVNITCKIHGEFKQIPMSHLQGHGCSKCQLCPKCQLWHTNGRLCVYCKPKKSNKLYQKTNEWKVVEFLRKKLPDHNFIHNKSVGKDCTGGHLFPDIRFDLGFYQLIIEVDEHKHRGANYKCDKQRMYNIISKLGMPCIYIRYNPDNKKSNTGTLLNLVNKYLELNIGDKPWNDYGFLAKYLFY